MTEVDQLGDYIGETAKDKDNIKTQFATGSVVSWYKTFTNAINIDDVDYSIKVRSVSGDKLFWDNTTYGIWNAQKWGWGVTGSDYPSGTSWYYHISGDDLN